MNLLNRWLLLSGLFIIRSLVSGEPVDDPCSSPCPPCPMIMGCAQLQKDECGCCDLCVKEHGQLCGAGIGVCGADMECNQDEQNVFTCEPSAAPIAGPVIVITPRKVSSASKKQPKPDQIAARKLKKANRNAARQQQRADKKKRKEAERKAKKEAKKERKRLAQAGNGAIIGNPITDVDDGEATTTGAQRTKDNDDASISDANGMDKDGTDPNDTGDDIDVDVTGDDTDVGVTGGDTDVGVTGDDTDAGVTGDDTDAGVTGDDTDAGATGDDTDAGVTGDDTDAGVTGDDTDIDGAMDKRRAKEERKAHKEARKEKKRGKDSGNTDHMSKSDSNGSQNGANDADGDLDNGGGAGETNNGHEVSSVMEPVTDMPTMGNAKSERKAAKKLARKKAKQEKKLAKKLAKLKAKAMKNPPSQNELINVDETTTLTATTMLS